MAFCVVKKKKKFQLDSNTTCLLRSNFRSRVSYVCLQNPRPSLVYDEKMAAHAGKNKDCVICFSIFCQKITRLVRKRIIRSKMIYINTKIK